MDFGIARQRSTPRCATFSEREWKRPGLYLRQTSIGISSPTFLFCRPPRELQPKFRKFAMPILKSIIEVPLVRAASYSIAGWGIAVEKAIGKLLRFQASS